MPYVVLSLEKNVTLSAPWIAKQSVPLSFADGMIGAMPVFETREQAEKYANGRLQIAELAIVGESA